jgi:hypothetical protein
VQTYSVDLRHAASKRALNATPDNRLDPLRRRLETDAEAVAWARAELLDFARHRSGEDYQYVEAAVIALLPIGQLVGGKDYRRLGRWVCNADGLTWRPSPALAEA